MWDSAIIVFREVFEIAIIVCVVLAATKDMSKERGKWIIFGMLGGMAGATLFALITQGLAVLSDGAGKLYFNAGVLLTAAAMIGWTVVWMKQHARTITQDLKQVGQAVTAGTTPIYMLAIVVGLAVLREGSEIVLFLYGLIAAGQTTWFSALAGSLVGLGLGSFFGLLMYYGLLRVSIKYLFSVTSILLTLIASGMAANAAGKLVHAGLLPALVDSLWNTAFILPQHSLLGRFLFILIGYQENPNGMQILFYLLTLTMVVLATRRQVRV